MKRSSETLHKSRPCDFYVGPSMLPTLRPLDRLKLIDYGKRPIRPGDVIVFRSPTDGRRLTHRVIRSKARKIVTRGDNNDRNDPWVLRPEEVQGQVVFARRNGRWIVIRGALEGRIRAAGIRFIRQNIRMVYRLTGGIYRKVTRNRGIRLKLPFRDIYRILSFQRPEGTEFQLLVGSLLVARRSEKSGRWRLYRPYAWFLDDKSLPEPSSGWDKTGKPL